MTLSLAGVLGRVWRLVDRALPPSLRSGDPASLQVARLTLVFSLCLLVWGPTFAVVYLALGAPRLAFYVAVATVVVGTAPLTLRFTGRGHLASHQVLVGLTGVLLALASQTGGLYAPTMVWFLAIPLMAMAMLGMRGALLWSGVAMTAIIAFATLALLGVAMPSTLTGMAGIINAASSLPAVLTLVFSLAATFELSKNQMASELAAERELAEGARDQARLAHAAARHILDAVDQGLFMLAPDGTVKGETSRTAAHWFGTPSTGAKAWTWLEAHDADAATWMALGHEAFRDDILPREVTLAQMPQQLRCGDRTLRLRWLPIADSGELLVVASDVTAALAAERSERAQRALVAVFQRISADRRGFFEFLEEADRLVHDVGVGPDMATAARHIHTLKGNCGLFGLTTVAEACHALESQMAEQGGQLTDANRASLQGLWRETQESLAPFLGRQAKNVVEITRTDVDVALRAIIDKRPHDEVEELVRRWIREPTRVRLERAAEQLRGLAMRLGKGTVDVRIDDHGVAVEPERWGPFWAAFAHALRNAVDHGLETPEERLAAGKSPVGTITLDTHEDGDDFVVRIIDDGRGIDWDRVREKARRTGLRADTPEERVEALFAEGMSTAEAVSDISGRGVGMSALREATVALGGSVLVTSTRGQGTTLEFRFSDDSDDVAPRALAA